MAGLNVAIKNVMLDAAGGVIGYVSLHSADPGATGTSEITGGSPAYSRVAISWASASNASKTSSNQPAFNVPAGSTIAYIGYWSALTGGTFYGSSPITSETYGAQGTYTLTSDTFSLT